MNKLITQAEKFRLWQKQITYAEHYAMSGKQLYELMLKKPQRGNMKTHWHNCSKCKAQLAIGCGCGHPLVNTDICFRCANIVTLLYLIHVISSAYDLNGNSYHHATLTRIADGKVISGVIDGATNARGYFLRAGITGNRLYETEATLPIRKFKAVTRNADYITLDVVKNFIGSECKPL